MKQVTSVCVSSDAKETVGRVKVFREDSTGRIILKADTSKKPYKDLLSKVLTDIEDAINKDINL